MSDLVSTDAAAPQSVWSSLISIVDKPQATFTNLLAQPRLKWVLPVVLGILVLVINVWMTASYSSELARQAAEQQWQAMGISPEQVEELRAQSSRFNSPVATGISGTIFGTLVLLLIWLGSAGLFYFTALITGAELKFGSVFLVVTWSTLPLTLRTLIQTIYTAITGTFPVYSGLSALQVTGNILKDSTNPLIAVLSYIDPFWIWHLVLLIVGLSVVTKFSRTKTFFMVLVYALVAIGLGVLPVLLARMFSFGG
jgi:hypothetical protein